VMGVGARIASWLAPFICRFALRGVGLNGFTPTAEAALPPDALKKAVQSLLAGFDAIGAQRVRAGAGPQQPGWLRTLNYLFGTGGIATSRLVEALSAGGSGPIYHGLLELSETESPKVRSGHGIDCFVLCRSDVPSYDRYLAEMVTGQPRFPASFDALSALTVKCWTTFAATGAPGELRGGVAWPPLPECMRLRSTGSATEPSEHAPNSDELKLWKRVCKEQHLPLGRFA